MAHGMQGDKQKKKACHLVLNLKLVLVSKKMVEEVVPMSPIAKCSSWTKAKMAIVKTKRSSQTKFVNPKGGQIGCG